MKKIISLVSLAILLSATGCVYRGDRGDRGDGHSGYDHHDDRGPTVIVRDPAVVVH